MSPSRARRQKAASRAASCIGSALPKLLRPQEKQLVDLAETVLGHLR
jgi:hypothetical protein